MIDEEIKKNALDLLTKILEMDCSGVCYLGEPVHKVYAERDRLKKENAELKERLKNAVFLPCELRTKFYCVYEWQSEEDIEENECCGYDFSDKNNVQICDGIGCGFLLGEHDGLFVTLDRAEAEEYVRKPKGDD